MYQVPSGMFADRDDPLGPGPGDPLVKLRPVATTLTIAKSPVDRVVECQDPRTRAEEWQAEMVGRVEQLDPVEPAQE